MLQSIKQLYGKKLGASDGDIGHVKDFYFDDRNWAVRYLVADTGDWLPGRQVLIAPHPFKNFQLVGNILNVDLTRKQIEKSPSIESHKPVSRQYEEEYYRYFGWPNYWQGDGLWGATGFPILEQPATSRSSEHATANPRPSEINEIHLRSAQAVNGYHLHAKNGIIGHICDFMVDDKTWAIDQLVIKVGHRFTGKEIQMPTNKVERISYADSTIFASLSEEAIEQNHAAHSIPIGAID